ncbi:hypothetical protein QE152_g7007 [Popillia japonica]|uniref:Uncharacterized protein n=1 Tax=Popillia japonica TaxID=7064 RepID=A0AAW1MGP0_POPJA
MSVTDIVYIQKTVVLDPMKILWTFCGRKLITNVDSLEMCLKDIHIISAQDMRMIAIWDIRNKVWSFSELENINEGEVDALFAEIPSDGESVDEFGESDGEENASTNTYGPYRRNDRRLTGNRLMNLVNPMVRKMPLLIPMDHIEETIVAPPQNISDSEEDDEEDLLLSHLQPKDIFTWKKPLDVERWDQSLHMPIYGNYGRCALCSTRDCQRRTK